MSLSRTHSLPSDEVSVLPSVHLPIFLSLDYCIILQDNAVLYNSVTEK